MLQGAQFIHKIKLPDHTLAGQLCPLSLSSAACRGQQKQNHHLHRPQQTSQVCWWSETTETANLPQECVKEREAVSLAQPSLIHETASPSSAPWQEAARAAAPTGCPAPVPWEQSQSQQCSPSTALLALRAGIIHLTRAAALCQRLVTVIPFLSLWPRVFWIWK